MTRGDFTVGHVLLRAARPVTDLPPMTARPWHVPVLVLWGAILMSGTLLAGALPLMSGMGVESAAASAMVMGPVAVAGLLAARFGRAVMLRQAGVAAATGAHAVLTAVAFIMAESALVAALMAWTMAAVTWRVVTDQTYVFATAAVSLVMTCLALVGILLRGAMPGLAVVTIFTAAVLFFAVRWALAPRPGPDLLPAARGLLFIMVPATAVFFGVYMIGAAERVGPLTAQGTAFLLTAPYLAATLVVLAPLYRCRHGWSIPPTLLALCGLLPVGAPGLLLLALGWRLDSRGTAGLGFVVLLGFLGVHSLMPVPGPLAKSALLMAGGLLTLSLWALARRGRPA